MATIDQLFAAIERATPGISPFTPDERHALDISDASGVLETVLAGSPRLRAKLEGVLEDPRYRYALADQAEAWRALLKTEPSAPYASARRRWSGQLATVATNGNADELEKAFRPEIDRLTSEADTLAFSGNKSAAFPIYLEAAFCADRVASAYRSQYFGHDLIEWSLRNDPESYFRIARPVSFSKAKDYASRTHDLLYKAGENGDLQTAVRARSHLLDRIVALYAQRHVETAIRLFRIFNADNDLIVPGDHFLLVALGQTLALEEAHDRAVSRKNDAHRTVILPHLAEARVQLYSLISKTRRDMLDKDPILARGLALGVCEGMSEVVHSILSRRAYPAPFDWHNFFAHYRRELRTSAGLATDDDRTLANFWNLRFGKTFYVRLGHIEFDQEYLEELDALLPKLRDLTARGTMRPEWLTDAIDFRARIEEHLTTGQPLALFPDTANEEDVLSVAREVVRLGRTTRQVDWRRHPVKAVKRYVHKKQDEMTKLLAKHPDLLDRMMKFTDALPEIENDAGEIVRHFREYFPEPDPRLPPSVNRAIRLAHNKRIPAELVAFGIKKVIMVMAYRYLSAETPKEAFKDFRRMAKAGMGVIGDILGEAVTNDEEADAYMKSYFDLIKNLSSDSGLIAQLRANRARHTYLPSFAVEDQPDFQLAIKFSALCPYSQWNSTDPEETSEIVKGRFRQVLDRINEAQKKQGVRIQLTVDPEEYEFRDLCMKIYKEVMMEPKYREMRNVGVGIQLYLKDSLAVLADLIAWSEARGGSVPIRLIKGAYWDFENLATSQKGYSLPVWPEKWMSDVAFERGVDLALSHFKAVRVAVGSHNTRAVAYSIAESLRRKVPIEIQMLYGMADETKRALVAMGIPISVYSPIGRLLQGMAYFARRILENASQNSFLLQSSDMTEEEIIELLKKPLPEGAEWPPKFAPDPVPFTYRVTSLDDPFVNEPLTEYWRVENLKVIRTAFDHCLTLPLPPPLEGGGEGEGASTNYPLMINGEWVTPRKAFVRRNPANPDEILGVIAHAGKDEVKATVDAAQSSLESWSKLDVRLRAQVLLESAALMRRQKAVLTAIMMKESGKPLREADGDVAEAIDFLEYYAREGVRIFEGNPHLAVTPKGVSAIIAPWNFPLAILTAMSAAALVMGNSVILKPAEPSSIIAHHLAQIYQMAAQVVEARIRTARPSAPTGSFASAQDDESPIIPRGFVNYIAGKGSGALLRQHPEVKLVSFTGSAEVGLKIYSEDAPRGVKVIAEMGGKNAMIVDRDAHPDDVIKAVLYAKWGYAGQKCSALDRLIIVGDEKHFRKMVDRLVKAAAEIPVGGTDKFGNYYGPVIDEESYKRLLKLIGQAAGEIDDHEFYARIKQGRLLLDGRHHRHLPKKGYFIGPTIFEINDPRVKLFQEETFGPVFSVTRARSLDEAIALARDSMFNLTGAALTRSPHNLEVLERDWQGVGNLYLLRHQTGAVVGRQPFGGNNLSGIGGSKAGGRDYLWQFVNIALREEERTRDRLTNYPKAFLATKIATKGRMEKPEIYQADLLGETNKVVYRPRGKGWIIIGKETHAAEAAALLSAAIYSGNDIVVTAVSEQLSLVNSLVDFARLRDDFPKVTITTGLHPSKPDELEKLATDPSIKWVAFGGKNQVDKRIVEMATKTPPGQNFVRVIIAEDPLAFAATHGGVNPTIFAGMTEPQTVTLNTARHSFDAKKAMEKKDPTPPKPTGGGSPSGTPSSSSRPRESTRPAGIQLAVSSSGSPPPISARGGDDKNLSHVILRTALRYRLRDVARYVAGMSESDLRAFAASAAKNWDKFLEANGLGEFAKVLKASGAQLKAADTLFLTLAAMADSRRDVEQILDRMANEGRLNIAKAGAASPSSFPQGIGLPGIQGGPPSLPVFVGR